MHKIASPKELQTELRRLLAYVQSERPSRIVLAAEFRALASRLATEFDTKEELDAYLKEHPDADRSNHSVKSKGDDAEGKEEKPAKRSNPALDAWHEKNKKERERKEEWARQDTEAYRMKPRRRD